MPSGGGVERTHDLAHLVDVAASLGAVVPPDVEAARTLTPFAVEHRYGFMDEDEGAPFDRSAARARVTAVRGWAEEIVDATSLS